MRFSTVLLNVTEPVNLSCTVGCGILGATLSLEARIDVTTNPAFISCGCHRILFLNGYRFLSALAKKNNSEVYENFKPTLNCFQ